MKKSMRSIGLFVSALGTFLLSCTESGNSPSQTLIKSMNLKRGEVITCGPADKEFGTLNFDFSGDPKVRDNLNLAVKLLHSFEYDEAEKVFADVIDVDPDCAMAYWGIAMANFHPLWAPPGEPELQKGAKAIDIAQSLKRKSSKEADYIAAIAAFYNDWQTVDHRTRCIRFEKAMEALTRKYPADKEAAVFYALALTAAADPKDKTYAMQKKAGALLNSLYPGQPNHPGIVHYLIHAYDYPELAQLGLSAARKYASIAPSSAHALHMPSHIFTRLGLWDEAIQSNQASVSNARCYAQQAGIKGHWDEEMHGLDYLVYAYLQKGDTASAEEQWTYIKEIQTISPPNFKVAYSLAAIPARILLENRRWKEAADLQLHQANVPWEKFPWEKSNYHFARMMGAVHTNNNLLAQQECNMLEKLQQQLLQNKNTFQADKVQIQCLTGKAWMLFRQGKTAEALNQMQLAADLEDQSEKHPVTPGDVLPARELLGDLLLQMNKPQEAFQAYEINLKKNPNRFNGLYGAGMAAMQAGMDEKAARYFSQLVTVAAQSQRQELKEARKFLDQYRSRNMVAWNRNPR